MIKKIALLILVLYSLLGFILLPIVLKSQIIDIVKEQTNVKIAVDDISFNPFMFNLELAGVVLKGCEDEHIVSFSSLEIDLEPHSLLKAAVHVKNIVLNRPRVSLVYNKDKTFNFTGILKEKPEKSVEDKNSEEGGGLPRVIIDTVKIENGTLDYEDFTRPKKFELAVNDIDLKLKDIDTNDFDSSDASLRFYSALGDGGEIDFRTQVVSFKPLTLKGSLKFEASKLYTQWKYFQDKLGVEVADGRLSFDADYFVNVDDLNSTTIDNMRLSLENLRVKPKNKTADILNLKFLHVDGVVVKPMLQDVHVKEIALDSLLVKAKRDENGDIDWLDYIKSQEDIPKETQEASEKEAVDENATQTAPWNVVLESISLQKIAVDIDDASVKPNVNTRLNELNINLKDVTLAGEKPFLYDMSLILNEKFKCNANGDVKHKILDANAYLTCQGFDIVHYRPYIDQIASKELKTYNLALKSATANFSLNANVKDENSAINAIVDKADFSLKSFALNSKDKDEKLIDFGSFDINGIGLNTKTKEVSVSKVSLNGLAVHAKKDKEGVVNFDALVEPKEAKKEETNKEKSETVKKEKPYRVKLKHFNINSAQVAFKDDSLENSTTSKIDKINLNAYSIDSIEKSWLKYDMSLRVNKKGLIKSKGKLRHTPLKQKGTFSLNKVSLKEFTPYIQESAYLKINDGYLSLDSKLEYSKKENSSDLDVTGKLKVEEFFLHDSRDESTIASFGLAELKSFNFKMFPNSLYIDEASLESFYLDAVIDENKNMNLAKLTKVKSDANLTKQEDINTTVSKKETPFPLKIMKFHVSDGAANFADYSLPVMFKTSIHDLNGDVYAISNNKGEVSYVDIDGEVDKYGSTKLKGSIEPSDIKSYTDIEFSFKNLGLDSFSGYSAQFAGYKINKGKLFLDLGYKIYDSELLGKNSLIIKSIELGDEVEDENITKLPLGFAIALLEDSEGVIDINMPVEGNMDSPDFKYGALVVKTLANLIVKAVASPFNFLGAAMGLSGDDLKYVEFEASKFVILPPEKEKLDNLAKILLKKPKLSLGIHGSYNLQEDKRAIQANKLQEQVLKVSGKNGVITVDILEDIYSNSVGDKLLDTLEKEFEKRYPKDEVFKIEYRKELLERCRDIQAVSVEELKSLASSRANVIQDYLVQTKNIDLSRIIVNETKENDDGIQTELEIVVK